MEFRLLSGPQILLNNKENLSLSLHEQLQELTRIKPVIDEIEKQFNKYPKTQLNSKSSSDMEFFRRNYSITYGSENNDNQFYFKVSGCGFVSECVVVTIHERFVFVSPPCNDKYKSKFDGQFVLRRYGVCSEDDLILSLEDGVALVIQRINKVIDKYFSFPVNSDCL